MFLKQYKLKYIQILIDNAIGRTPWQAVDKQELELSLLEEI